ncbi:hypothetical protein Q7P37_002391 [Cladosporium fusiforme]
MSRLQDIPLASVTGNLESRGLNLLICVVSVNDKDQPTLPVREIWAGIDMDDGKVHYEVFSAQSIYDTDEEEMSLDEVNSDMLGHRWLRSLEPCKVLKTDTDLSHVTQVIRAGTCFWKEISDEHGQRCYVIDEDALKIWLDNGAGNADIDDDGESWDEPEAVDKPLWPEDDEADEDDD